MRERAQRVMAVMFSGTSRGAEVRWRPRADAYRTRAGWVLKFDLAGVQREDVEVRVDGCRITVAGKRRDCFIEEGGYYYLMEISYNRFERTIELPCDLDSPEVGLEFRDGILLVRVKTE